MTAPAPDLRRLRQRLAGALAADYPRLRRELDRWRADAPDAEATLAALRAAIEQSAQRVEQRRARVPAIRVPEVLPIAARSEEIVAAIRAHQVVVVAGATGSGKTTQLPKLCLAAGRGGAGLIGCTQPRRIAAKSIARRVAEELESPLGALVGFAVRFQDQVGEDALVKFMTDGILLAETQSDRLLRRYDTLIIDEAHERSLNIDFLLGYLKRLLPKRPDLKLIITSATIDTSRFAEHFGQAPVIEVEGRGFPVEIRWRPITGDKEERADNGLYQAIAGAVEELGREDPRGDILVFLPGEREIRDAHKALEQRRYAHTEVLPLYARLSGAAQDRVFQPGPQRRIVLATNVAETSITVPRIRFVIDSGIARVNRYSQRAKVQRLQIEAISQASANQRAGRCGRLSAGVCVRLYDEADFQRRPLYTDPELLRSSLAGVILRMLDLDLGDPTSFPFLDPPGERAIHDGFLLLHELGAIDEHRQLNATGRAMARLPIDVRLARFLIAARPGAERPGSNLDVSEEALVIAAALSVQDPRERPQEVRALADAAHQAWVHEKSDFLTLLQLWQAYTHEHEERTQSQLREWCRTHFLSYLRMREWRELHRQLLLVVREEGREAGLGTAKSRDSGLGAAKSRDSGLGTAKDRDSGLGTRDSGARGPTGSGSAAAARMTPTAERRDPGLGTRDSGAGGAQGSGPKAAARMTPTAERRDPGLGTRDSGARGPTSSGSAAAARMTPTAERRDPGLGTRDSEPPTALTDPRAYEALHRALLAAFVTQVARKEDKQRYRGPRGRVAQIFPGSGQAKSAPNWIVAATLLETEKLYALMVARIDPGWIEAAATHLSKRQYYEPSWDEKGGRSVGFEDVLLYGLPIVTRRRISYSAVDPVASRQLFLRHQLVRGEGPARHPVLAHNAAMRADAHAKEEKLRRRGLLRDEEQLAEWFEARCPQGILDSHGLERWLKQASPAEREALKLSLDDLVIPSARGDERLEFPDALEIEGARLLLSYQFAPNGARDGVTAQVPLAVLPGLSTADVDWLVPGLRAEKAAALIKILPKALRRHAVPAPDFAQAFLEAAEPRQQPFAQALAVFLSRVTGAEIRESDFDPTTLPPHLLLNLAVIGPDGCTLAEDRDLNTLKTRFAEAARAAFAARVDALYHRERLSEWPLDEIPADVRAEGGARAWPALVDTGSEVALRAYADAGEAQQAHPRGVRRLLLIQIDDQLRYWMRHLKLSGDAQMAYGVVDRVDSLRRDLIEAAFDRVCGDQLGEVRTRAAFEAWLVRVRRELGPAVQALTERVDAILKAVKTLRSALQPPLMGYATANLLDAREHLESLVHPGFLHEVGFERLAHYPRYLEGLRLRLERLKRDPARDQAKLLEVQPFWRAWQRLHAARHPDADALRWLVEEFRVSQFAQELKTAEPVSAKRLAKLVGE